MKRHVTIVLIFAIFVAVYLLFPDDKKNVENKHITHDVVSEPEPISQVEDHLGDAQEDALRDPQGDPISVDNQKIQNAKAQYYNGQRLEPEIEKAISELVITSHEGLVEEETDNGIRVDLKGRFRTAPVATIDDNGQVIVQDYTSAPGR